MARPACRHVPVDVAYPTSRRFIAGEGDLPGVTEKADDGCFDLAPATVERIGMMAEVDLCAPLRYEPDLREGPSRRPGADPPSGSPPTGEPKPKPSRKYEQMAAL